MKVWDDKVELVLEVKGTGSPLVYLHSVAGLLGGDPFLDALAESFTVYAPHFPGSGPGDPAAIEQVGDVWDAVLIYEEAIRKLDLGRPPVVGHSFGGMLAGELIATFPQLFSRAVLLDAIGLWREDAPIGNWLAATPPELAGYLFHDPSSPPAQTALALPADEAARAAALEGLGRAFGSTGKLAWPPSALTLRKRLHRVEVPVLVVWGAEDTLVPPVYADEFGREIPGARVVKIPASGHMPQVEKTAETLAATRPFLG